MREPCATPLVSKPSTIVSGYCGQWQTLKKKVSRCSNTQTALRQKFGTWGNGAIFGRLWDVLMRRCFGWGDCPFGVDARRWLRLSQPGWLCHFEDAGELQTGFPRCAGAHCHGILPALLWAPLAAFARASAPHSEICRGEYRPK